MSLFRKYLIPHKHNDFHPHFFRASSVRNTTLVLIGSFFLFSQLLTWLPKVDLFSAVYVGTLVSYTNEARLVNGNQALKTNSLLIQAAQLKANDMATKGYFSHNSPDGRSPWYWLDQVGYKYKYAGENLAIDFVDSRDVTNAWMSSPGHRANMLNSQLTEVGIATAVGVYQGRETTFIVQMFGAPADMPVQVVPEKVSVVAPVEGIVEMDDSQVAGAFANGASVVEKVASSPKIAISVLYLVFTLIVSSSLITAAVIEWRRHHKRIWIAGGALVILATGLIIWMLKVGQGIVS